MGPTLLLVLAFVAGSYAGPIQTEISIGNQCSRQCTVSNKFNYEPGRTYEFQYDNEIRTALQGASEDHAGIHMTAKIQLDFVTKCEVVMRISEVTLKEHNPDTVSMTEVTAALADLLEKNPVRLSYQDGQIEHMCLSAEEAPEIVNIKRGILSMFQNSMDDITKGQSVPESDVNGNCETEYTSEEKGWYNQKITKSKNLLGCTERHGYNSAIQGIPYSSQSKVQSLPLLKSTHMCEQEVVRDHGRLVSALCQEKHTFAPFSRGDSGATTHNTQRLTFVSETKTKSKPVRVFTKVPLQFEHGKNVEMQSNTRKDLKNKLMEVCDTTKDGVRTDTPRLFTALVNIMKMMEASDMAAVYEQIKTKAVCADNNKIVKKFFLDAIPMTGTTSGLKMMTSLITSQEVSGTEADMWLTTLAFIQHPTASMLAEVKPLLSMTKNAEKAMLSVSSLVHNFCKKTANCNNIPEVKKILYALESKIAKCKVIPSTFETTLIALRSIGNTGFAASSLINTLTLGKCIKLTSNPIEIRLSAIETLGMSSCKSDRSDITDIFTNIEEDSEVRIAAYKALMKCPSNEILRKIKLTLGKEEVNQVGSYVWSHLTNLMETSDPHKQAIRSILEDSVLQKEFNMDKRKFSRNYEGSMFIEKINTGATVEADLIWSSKSFIPRSAMANLTVDLFGNAVNLFEIGGRIEGLEYFLEAYFGPNGHFSENDVQAAADETALQLVKSDKVNRINKRMGSAMDDLRGSLYVKVFGNELRHMNFQGLDSLLAQNSINFLDILMQLKNGNDYQFTQSSTFLDSSIIVPTSSGFPLNLTVNGTATVDLKASGKMDVMKLASTSSPSLDVQGEIRPSGAVMISSMMSVDAFVTKVGIRMVSSLHSNTALKGKVSLSDGRIFNMELDAPEKKMDIFNVKTAFFTVHRDIEREQKMITENRQEMQSCTGMKLAKITGLQLCGEVQFPNASLVENAPYFPITGPVNVGIYLNKKDSFTSYKLEARSTHTRKENVVRVAFSTPNGKIDRNFGINFDLNKVSRTLDASLTSPWRNADFKGAVTKSKTEIGVSGKLNIDNSVRYEIKAHVKSAKSGPGMMYTPTVVVRGPAMTPIEMSGTIKYAAWKLFDVDVDVIGITKLPVTIKTAMFNKVKMVRFAASIASGKNSPYSFNVAVQKIQLKTKVSYKPQISIRTPTTEVLAFGGNVAYAYGKNIIVQGVLDKVFKKKVSFKTVLKRREYRRGRVLYNTRLDFRSPVADFKMKTKLDNRNMKSVATDVDLTYVIRRYARDNIKFVSKVINLSTKALTKGKANMLMTSKKRPEINFKFSGNVNHNKKHSEIEADFAYGDNPKDDEKQVSLSASIDRAIKSWSMASGSFKGEFVLGKDIRMVSRINHAHTKKSLDSSIMLRLNKNAISSSLTLSDKSTSLMNVAGKFDLSYPGKIVSIAQTVSENTTSGFVSTLNAQIGKSKHNVVTSWNKESPNSLTISSDVSLNGFDPVHIEGVYNMKENSYTASGSLKKGSATYRLAGTSNFITGKKVEISSEVEYPSRHVIANFEGRKTGDKFAARTDLRWDANRDDTKRVTLLGNGQYLGVNNIEGSATLQYPSRTLSANLKHTSKGNMNTHVDFKWDSKKQISVDASFSKSERKTSLTSGTLKLRTPFKSLKSFDVSIENEVEDAQYKTNLNVEWNPKNIISVIATLKRPLSMQTINADIAAKTPFKSFKSVKATLRHNIKQGLRTVGKISCNKKSAQFDLSIENNSADHKMDIRGQLDIKSTFKALKVASVDLSHNSNGRGKFQTSANLQHNKNKYSLKSSLKHTVKGWNVDNNAEITITNPSQTISIKWDHINTLSEITSSLETTWAKNKRAYIKYSGYQNFTWAEGKMSSALEIQTPFKPIRDIIFQMNHQHRPDQIDSSLRIESTRTQVAFVAGKYLKEDGKVTSSFSVNDAKVNGIVEYKDYPVSGHLEAVLSPKATVVFDGTYNRDDNDNVDGVMTVNISSMDPVVFTVQTEPKRGRTDSVAKLQYKDGKVIILESTHRLDSRKMLNLKFISPFTQEYNAAISLQGTAKQFDASASIEAQPFVPRWSAVASFDSRNQVTGMLKVNTPFRNVSHSQISFTSALANDVRKSSLMIEYAPGMEVAISSEYRLQSANNIMASVEITTPFTQMPYSSFAITHQGNLYNGFVSHTEFDYAQGKKIAIDTNLSKDNGLAGALTIKTPFSRDITGSFSHTGDLTSFQSHGDFSWETSHSIDIKHEGNLEQFKSSFDYSKDNAAYRTMISFVQQPTMLTEITFDSPIKGWQSVRFSHSFNGNLSTFSNIAELYLSKYGKFAADVSADTIGTKSLTVTINTPYKKYSNLRAVVTHEGDLRQFQTHAEFHNGKNKLAGDVRFNIKPSMNFELSLKTPFTVYRSSRLAATFDGKSDNFKIHTEAQLNKAVHEAELLFDYKKKLSIDMTVKSPEIDTIKASLDHWGSWKKFNSKVIVKQGKNKIASDIRFQLKPSFKASVSIKSPFKMLKNQQFTVKHAGTMDSFKCNMQYKCNGKVYVGDAVFQNLQTLKAEMNLKGPEFKPINVLITHEGTIANFESSAEMSMGKKKVQASVNINTLKGVTGSVSFNSPIAGFKSIKAAVSHTGTINKFKCHLEAFYNKQKGQTDIDFDATNGISASINVATPFKGYETLSILLKHAGSVKNFHTLVQLEKKGKRVESQVQINFGQTISGSAVITSQFTGIKNCEISFNHEGSRDKFTTRGQMAFDGQRSEVSAFYDSTDGYTGNFELIAPFMKQVQGEFRHSSVKKVCSTHAQVTIGRDTYNLETEMRSKTPLGANVRIQTPFDGFETTEALIHIDGNKQQFVSRAELTFKGSKHSIELHSASSPDLDTKLIVLSPFLNDLTITFEVSGPRSNFRSAFDLIYGTESILNSELTLQIDGPISGDFRMSSTLMKTIKASFSHSGRLNDFSTQARLQYAKQKIEGSMLFKYTTDMEASLRLASPFCDDIEVELTSTGSLSNCRNTGKLIYGGEPQVTFSSNFHIDPTIDLEVTIETTLPGYSNFVLKGRHAGVLHNFRSFVEATLEDQTMTGDVVFSPRRGSISIRAPMIKNIDGRFMVEGELPRIESEIKLTYGKVDLLDASSNINWPSNAEFVLMTPLKQYKKTRVAVTNSIAGDEYASHGELLFAGLTHQMDVSLNSDNAQVAVQSPFITPIAFKIDFSKNVDIFQYSGEITLGGNKHSMQITFGMENKIVGSILVQSPLMSEVSGTFRTTTNMKQLETQIQVLYGKRTLLDAVVVSSIANKKSVSVSIQVLDDLLKASTSLSGSIRNFNVNGEIFVNRQIGEADVSFNLMDGVAGSLTVDSPLIPFKALRISQSGDIKDFISHADLELDSSKHEVDINWQLEKRIDGSFSIKSPTITPISSKVVYENKKIEAEIRVKDDIHQLSGSLSLDRLIKSNIHIESSLCEAVDVTFQTNKNIKRLNSKFGLVYGRNELLGIEATTNFMKSISSSVTVRAPENMIKGLITAEGDMSDFTGHMQFNLNDKMWESDASLSLKDDVQGNFKWSSPSDQVAITMSHSGSLMNFQSNGRLTFNDYVSEIDAMLNVESAKKGSLKVSTPISKPLIASFDHSGDFESFKSVASVEYGQVHTIQAETTFSFEPLQGTIKVDSTIPGYETVSAAFNHKGHTLDFSNHAEFSIVGQTTQVDMMFNVGSKLEGRFSASSPYFTSTSASFDFSGNLDDFTTQLTFLSNKDEYDINASFSMKTSIDGSLTIKTPIKGYKKIVGTLSHTGNFPNINSMVQLKTGRRTLIVVRAQLSTIGGIVCQFSVQSILTPAMQLNVNHNGEWTAFTSSADIRLNGQSTSSSVSFKTSPSFEGTLSLTSPYFRPLNGNFKVAGSLRDFSANVKGTAGTDSLSGNVMFNYNNDAAMEINIQTPFKNYETISGSAKYTKSYKGFISDIALNLPTDQNYELNTEAHWNRGLQGSILVKTPFTNMRQSSITANYYGVFPNVQSTMILECVDTKYAITTELSHDDSTRGKISIETPLAGFENIGLNFNSRGNIMDLQADAQMTYATGSEVSISVANAVSEGKIETKAKIESPFTEDFNLDISYNGSPYDFTNAVVMTLGADNAVSFVTSLKLDDMRIDFESKLTTTLAGNTEEQKAVFKYGDMKSSMLVKVLGSEYSLDTSLKTSASRTQGQLALVTPFQNVAFSIDHRGRLTRFTTKAKLEYGVQDYYKTISHITQFSKLSRGIQTSFELNTPFDDFETTKASYRHTTSINGFDCEMDASIMNKDFSGTLRASNSPLSATVSISTPFPDYEQIGANMKLNYGPSSYTSELNVAYMQGKVISISSDMNLESFPITANMKITTPIEGYETSDVSISFNGDLTNFQSVASLSSTFMPSMRAQANLRHTSWMNMDAEVTFSSQIRNFESLKFVLRNSALRGKYASRVEMSWSEEKSITLNSVFNIAKDSTTADVSLSTPFRVARQANFKSVGSKSGSRYVETVSAQYNDRTYFDVDMVIDVGEKSYASVYMKSPKEFSVDITRVSVNRKEEVTLNVNNDVNIVGSFDIRTNTVGLKYKCPRYNLAAGAAIDSNHPKAEIVIDNARYGFDMATTKHGGQAKVILPSRSFVLAGARTKRSAEGSFMWDADVDENKQIGFRTTLKPTREATKAEITLMMPSIGKDVQIDSEVIVNRGRVLFEGKGELTYSQDLRKKFTITSRIEDISNSYSSKNYTFSLGISHPQTTVGIQLDSHVAHSDDKITGGFDLKYQTVRRDTKTFSANGEINKIMKSVSFDVDTPIKKISIAGNAQVETPYSVSFTNKYDERRPLRTVLSLNPSKRSINFQMNYDEENPTSAFHVIAKYDNSSAVSAEMFHVVNRKRVTDAVASLRLNNSHLLHSRIHWRPAMLNDLMALAEKKGSGYNTRFSRSMSEVTTAIKNEASRKAKLIGVTVMDEMLPVMLIAAEQTEQFIEMYETNQYYVRNITDAAVASIDKVELVYGEIKAVSKEYIRQVSEQLKEKASACFANCRKNVDIVLAEVNKGMEYLSARCNNAHMHYSEQLHNMTRHPRVVAVQQHYNDYVTRINSIPVQEHLSKMADKYTSAIYSARDVINTHMASIMARSDVRYIKSITDKIAQQGKNAYTYWEIRENTEALANVIVQWIKSEIEKELSDLKATIINLKKTTVTVYDPQHGEIQMELHLIFPLNSLDEIPQVDVVPHITKAKRYISRYPKISLPSADISTWLPPFNAEAKIVGNQVTTFDGLTYDLDGKCTFILTKDFVDRNFSIGLNNGNNRSLTISADGKNIILLADGQVLVDNKLVTLPTILKNITIVSGENTIEVDGAGSFHVTYYVNLNAYVIELNGWYFGKVSGLLGTYDNEQSNEMMTSFGNVKNHAGRFSKSWDIGTARCR